LYFFVWVGFAVHPPKAKKKRTLRRTIKGFAGRNLPSEHGGQLSPEAAIEDCWPVGQHSRAVQVRAYLSPAALKT